MTAIAIKVWANFCLAPICFHLYVYAANNDTEQITVNENRPSKEVEYLNPYIFTVI
jgi:hypothetical protein